MKKTKKKVVAIALALVTAITTCPNYGLISRFSASDEAVESEQISDNDEIEIVEITTAETTEVSEATTEATTEIVDVPEDDETEVVDNTTEDVSTDDVSTEDESTTEDDISSEDDTEENTEEEEDIELPAWMDQYSDDLFIKLFGVEKAEFENVAKDVTISQGASYSYDGYSSANYSVAGENSKAYALSSFLLKGGSNLKAVPVVNNSFRKVMFYSYGAAGFKGGSLNDTIKEMEIDSIEGVTALAERTLQEAFNNIYYGKAVSGNLQVAEQLLGLNYNAGSFLPYILVDENDGQVKGFYFSPYYEMTMDEILSDEEEEEDEDWFERYSDDDFVNLFGMTKEEWEEKAADINVSVGNAYSFDGFSSKYYTVPGGKMYALGDYEITNDGEYKAVPVNKPNLTKNLYYVYGSAGFEFGAVPIVFYKQENLMNKDSINAISEKVVRNVFYNAYMGESKYSDEFTNFVTEVVSTYPSAPSSVNSYLVIDNTNGDIVGVYVTPFTDNTIYNEVGGAAGLTPDTLIPWEDKVESAEIKSESGLLSLASRVYNGEIPSTSGWQVTHRGNYKTSYGDTCGDFRVYKIANPNIYYQGYCIDHYRGEKKGTYTPNAFYVTNAAITRKILYYGFRDENTEDGRVFGAKYPYMSANNESARQAAICIMDLALDTAYNGTRHTASNAFYNWVGGQADVPHGKLEFVDLFTGEPFKSGVSSNYHDLERNQHIQATGWIKVVGDNSLTAKLDSLPSGVSIYKKNANGKIDKYDDNSVTFKNGDEFFLGTASYEGAYNTNLNYTTAPFTAVIADMGKSYQRVSSIVTGGSVVGGFNVSFAKNNGSVELRKAARKLENVANNPNYSYAGAVYAIFNANGIVATITTDQNGYGRVDNIPVGDYLVQETVPAPGFELNPSLYSVHVTNSSIPAQVQNGDSYNINDLWYLPEDEVAYKAAIKIASKVDSKTNQPLAGAVFRISFFALNHDGNPATLGFEPVRTWHLVSDSNGDVFMDNNHLDNKQMNSPFFTDKNNNIILPFGTLTIEEIAAPDNYKLDSTVNYMRTIRAEDLINGQLVYLPTITLAPTVPNKSLMDPIDILIYKTPADDKLPVSLMEGAEFKITHYDEKFDRVYNADFYSPSKNSDNQDRVWVMKTDDKGRVMFDNDHKVSGPAFDLNPSGYPSLPPGTLIIEEIKAPDNFILDNQKRIVTWNETENKYNSEVVRIGQEPHETFVQIKEVDNMYGKIEVHKLGNEKVWNEETQTFETKQKNLEGISFEIITNQNIVIPNWHQLDTPSPLIRKGQVVETITTGPNGYAETKENLPRGSYTIRELDSKYWITAPNQTVELGVDDIIYDKYDVPYSYVLAEFENQDSNIADVKTTATINNLHLAKPSENTVIVDKVEMTGLVVGDQYMLSGKLMDKNTKKPITNKNGLPITQTITFNADSANMTKEVQYAFNSIGMENASVVVYERLFNVTKGGGTVENAVIVAVHEEINDEGQTVRFPKVETEATVQSTASHVLPAATNQVIIDNFKYSNLIKGQKYTVKGILMDKDTGKELTINGKTVTKEVDFTPTSESGTVNVNFNLDASSLTGRTIVVFETLYFNGVEIAAHKDITDAKQRLNVIDVKTVALNKKTNTDEVLSEAEVTIVDTVKLSNLETGKTYKLKGTLYDKATSQPVLVNGKEVTAESAPFTPTSDTTTVDVEFNFDASSLKGKTLVAYEELFLGDVSVAKHNDITDEEQTVYFPEISTTAKDSVTLLRVAPVSKETKIIDTVSYSNLKIGKTYHLDGILMDKASGKAILVNGKEVKASADFTPTAKSGTADVTFSFDSTSLEGKSVVCYEYLTYDGKRLALHDDINDELQTIHFTKVHTTAMDSESQTEYSLADNNVTIIDDVAYENLIPGMDYVIKGVVIDKATGNPLVVDNKEVRAEKAFKPATANGTERLSFTFDASKLGNTTTVVFEEIYCTNKLVGSHKDINDEGQTVRIPEIGTKASDSVTGTNMANAAEMVTIKDVVSYKNLVVGKSYTVKGVLMDADTNKELLVDGNKVTAEKTFVANSVDGTVELEFTFKASALRGATVVVFEDVYYEGKHIATHADITDKDQTIYFPSLKTTAKDTRGGLHVALPDEKVTIVDTVEYSNLIADGRTYTITGALMNAETGEVIKNAGVPVGGTKEFKPAAPNGSVDISYTFNAKEYENVTVVVFEDLSLNGKTVASHKDLKDAGQSVQFTSTKTVGLDKKTGLHHALAEDSITITDKIDVKNLLKGIEYTVKGTIIDKATGTPLVIDGKPVTAEKKINPTANDITENIEFTFSGKGLEGRTFVVFEEIYYNNTIVAAHKDINDAEQTISIIEVKTKASDSSTGNNTSKADEEVSITDTVSYKGLIVGKTYTITGKLMLKSSGKELLDADGNTITASKTFKAESQNGTIDLVFKFDGSLLKGETIVVFENVYNEDKLVGTHSDITDEDQSIYFPAIGTTATDNETGLHISKPKEVIISDIVEYANLIPGETYTVKGHLRNVANGEIVKNGNVPVANEVTFVPEKANGTVEVTFKLDATKLNNQTVVVFEELYIGGEVIAEHKDLKDEGQSIHITEIGTKASDAETGEQITFPSEKITIVDTIEYKNLIPGKEYKVNGTLMNKKTNEPLLVDGKPVTASKTFKPEKANGSVNLEFVLNASALKGATIVVFESVQYEDIEVGVHADIEDEDQSIKFPEIETEARDAKTGNHTSLVEKEVTIYDKVMYNNLIVGKEYEIKGVLYEKESGKELIVNGKTVTASKKFVAEKSQGTEELAFTFDASALRGKTIVVFEDLYYEQKLIATHSDITDAEQSIDFPAIGTTATDKETGLHVSKPKEIVISDIVEYANLIPGETYKLLGSLRNVETGEIIMDGIIPVVAETTFVPEKADGTTEVIFKFDATNFENQTVVAFEELYYGENLIGMHKELKDEGQSVHFTEIGTKARDGETDEQITFPSEKITIVDTVMYKNLIPGKEYKVSGVLMNKKTNEPLLVNGEKITSEKTFKPESPNGSVDIEFVLDASALRGATIVVFESVQYEDIEVGVHADIEDEDQSISFPEIGTTALDSKTQTHVSEVAETVTIIDKVMYKNLLVGKEYKVSGVLMDKSTNEPLLVNGKQITAEKTFKATESEGFVELEYTLNSSSLKGKTVVVFEDLYYGEKLIATHSEIDDAEQTIYFPSAKTLAKNCANDTHMAVPNESVTINDTITYENLVPGLEYEARGYIMVKETGEKLVIDGVEITGSSKFIPTAANGTVDVNYTFNATNLRNKTLVVFEEIYLNNILVVEHKDIDDEGQTIHITDCGTKARDGQTGLQTILPQGTKTIKDYVEYKNLIVGNKYTVSGKLMDKKTNTPLVDKDGKEITASKEFVAETKDGVVELEFTFDASLLVDKVVVAFERILYEEKEVAVHADIDDEEQTTYFPSIDTVATESTSNGHYAMIGGTRTINDMVSFSSMQKGTEVTIKGILMDKATGKPIVIDGKQVTAEKTIVVESSSFSTTMSYTFNTDSLNGKTLVVYETAYIGDTVIAIHEDINDGDQSVSFSDQPKTGDSTNVLLVIVLALAALAGMVVMMVMKRRKSNN